MKLTSLVAPFVVSLSILTLSLSGCGSQQSQDTARIFTDEDIEILASLDEENLGSSQTMIEIIPAPIPPQPIAEMTGTAAQIQQALERNKAEEVAKVTQEPVARKAVTSPTPVAESFEDDSHKSAESISFEEKIQTALQKAGYYSGAIDGKVGTQTRKAIKKFQEEKGLKADGLVGPTTWQALRKYYSDQE